MSPDWLRRKCRLRGNCPQARGKARLFVVPSLVRHGGVRTWPHSNISRRDGFRCIERRVEKPGTVKRPPPRPNALNTVDIIDDACLVTFEGRPKQIVDASNNLKMHRQLLVLLYQPLREVRTHEGDLLLCRSKLFIEVIRRKHNASVMPLGGGLAGNVLTYFGLRS